MIIDLYAQHNIVVFLDFNKYVPYFTDYGTLQLFLEFGLPNKQIEVFFTQFEHGLFGIMIKNKYFVF